MISFDPKKPIYEFSHSDQYSICLLYTSDAADDLTRVEHCVELMPGFKPKRMRAYKVPEKLQPKAERQLLDAVLVAVRKFRYWFFGIKANHSQ